MLADLLIPLDAASAQPLYRQVYEGVRSAILSGRLPGGCRIPSSRQLADHLGVSRSTVLVAFDQLAAEGYVEGAVGSGSYVARAIPRHIARPSAGRVPASARPRASARLSTRGDAVASIPPMLPIAVPYPRLFWLGVPPVDTFPLLPWKRLVARRIRAVTAAELCHAPGAGYAPLRSMIAAHLAATRGMRCEPEQVIVLASAQEALELVSRVLLDGGDPVWLEDPGWRGARGAFLAAGARLVCLPVDSEGVDVREGVRLAPDARVAYVTPSHQFPLGGMLTLERRMALLRWAASREAWIIEDDYDSEYRHAGRPLSALHALDDAERVIYVGTFNKTIFPALRLAYLISPPSLTDKLLAARRVGGQHASPLAQAVVADFIGNGGYARHLRRSRAVIRERRDALVSAISQQGEGLLTLGPADTGSHAVAWLTHAVDDRKASEAAARAGVAAAPLSAFRIQQYQPPGLVLGYAGAAPKEIAAATGALVQAISGLVSAGTSGSVRPSRRNTV